MSINVNTFNKKKARLEVRSCPEIVREYVKLLEESNKRWEDLTKQAIKRLRDKEDPTKLHIPMTGHGSDICMVCGKSVSEHRSKAD